MLLGEDHPHGLHPSGSQRLSNFVPDKIVKAPKSASPVMVQTSKRAIEGGRVALGIHASCDISASLHVIPVNNTRD